MINRMHPRTTPTPPATSTNPPDRRCAVRMPLLITAGFAALALSFVGCRESGDADAGASGTAGERPTVMTTFYPTTYFVERIAGDTVEIVCPLPAGEDAKTWRPSDDVITQFQNADVIIVNGADFEGWVATANLPANRLIDSARPLADSFLQMEGETHSHGTAGEHTHEGTDPHTWVDPVNAKAQAQRIAEGLAGQYPDHAEQYNESYAELAADLDRLDAELQALTPRLEPVLLMASHPAYNYVATRYGWDVHNVFVDPGEPLSDTSANEIVALLDGNALAFPRIMLFEERPVSELEQALLNQFDIRTVIFSPAESLDSVKEIGGENATYLTVMLENVDRLAAKLPADG